MIIIFAFTQQWYLNNCGCAENAFTDPATIETMMSGSVKMLVDMGWDGVKFDSCSQFHNLTHWAELVNKTSPRPVLIENCHQGAYTPGMVQWQGFMKNSSTGVLTHFLGMFFGMGTATILPGNSTFAACTKHCDSAGADCGGFAFTSTDAEPTPSTAIGACYIMGANPRPNYMVMSNSNTCTGDSDPSDCPFNLYRVSGDISNNWKSVLTNLEYTLPFLGEGGMHPPFPQDATVRSRPGGWAYPDMLEVANLANATEDRSHFGAWSIMSSPLILSFNLSDVKKMDRVWSIISNRGVIAINQRWAGSPGRRITNVINKGGAEATGRGESWQAWAKPMGDKSFAIFMINTGETIVHASLPLRNVSQHFFAPSVPTCVKDYYTGKVHNTLSSVDFKAALNAHDSTMVCAWVGNCGDSDTKCPFPKPTNVALAGSDNF